MSQEVKHIEFFYCSCALTRAREICGLDCVDTHEPLTNTLKNLLHNINPFSCSMVNHMKNVEDHNLTGEIETFQSIYLETNLVPQKRDFIFHAGRISEPFRDFTLFRTNAPNVFARFSNGRAYRFSEACSDLFWDKLFCVYDFWHTMFVMSSQHKN